jgi:hypothetical protein
MPFSFFLVVKQGLLFDRDASRSDHPGKLRKTTENSEQVVCNVRKSDLFVDYKK